MVKLFNKSKLKQQFNETAQKGNMEKYGITAFHNCFLILINLI